MPSVLRPVVALLVACLTVSAAFALLTLLGRDDVVAYQLASGGGRTADELALTLWIRAGIVLVVAVAYAWVVRGLPRGRRAAYLRVRVIGVVGLAAVAYLLVSGAYPAWLRPVQWVQLGLLAALVVATNRGAVRELFPRPAPAGRRGGLGPALVLVVVTPLVAEVMLGTVSLASFWLVLLYVPIYGAGALFVRELVRRAGGGTGALLVLGLAYGLLEEGLALQSLTSPTLYGAAAWAPRLLGVNTAYAELNLPYHAVFSVLVPILVVETAFPGFGTGPYLGTPGVVVAGVCTLLGAALVRLSVPTAVDPDYQMSLPAIAAVVGLMAVLAVGALRVLPRRPAPVLTPSDPPTPGWTALATGAAAFLYLALLFPFGGASRPAFTSGGWTLLPMAAALVVLVAAVVVGMRWTAAATWTVRHRIGALGGALVAHGLFGALAETDGLADTLFVAGLALAVGGLATWAATRRDSSYRSTSVRGVQPGGPKT